MYSPEYENIISQNFEEYKTQFIKKNCKSLFYLKHKDYEDENEFRVCLVDENSHLRDKFLSIKDCLVGIIISDKFPKSDISKIVSLSKKSNILLSQIQLNGMRTIDFEQLFNP